VGCGGATGALNRGWQVAEAADDGGQELQRSSGKAWRSERRKRSRMGVRECKSESVGSSGMCFKSRRRHGERELLLASRRARGTRGDGGATWSGEKRASVGRVSGGRGAGGGTWREGGGQAQRETERGRGWRLKIGTCVQFFKNVGTPL
jgi:hypothetical protein